jgi:hypothetical protein
MWIALITAAFGAIIILGFSQSKRLEKWGRVYVSYITGKRNKPVD